MPVDPTSRFADLPLLDVSASDGTRRHVIGLRIPRTDLGTPIGRHVLREGEDLDLLARDLLGDEALWWRVLDANPLVHPFDLKPGDVLEIPGPGGATQVTRARSF
jgi:nucleoid-associated protein YgaU